MPIVTKKDIKNSEDEGDIIYDICLEEFPEEKIEREIIESSLTHPSGISNVYQVEQSLNERVHEWFRNNITDDADREVRKKVANKFYGKMHRRVEENYKTCKSKMEEKFENTDDVKLSTIRDEIISPVLS